MAAEAAIVALVVGPMLASSAFAQNALVDPPLHTGAGVNSPCATGGSSSGQCQYLYGGETNGITGNEADIYLPSNGVKSSLDPFYVIIGIPNIADPLVDQFASSDPISSAETYTGPAGKVEEDLTPSSGATQYKVMTGSDAYTLLGLTANNSESFTNWSEWDSKVNGINASNFGLYEFQLNPGKCVQKGGCSGIDFEGQELIDLQFSSALPVGTFVLGWGQQGNQAFANPFTETGLVVHQVPEPDSLALCALGLAGALGFGLRRKFVKT